MSRKHFSWLLVITLLVAAAALLMPGQTARDSGAVAAALLPELEERVNDIDWLQVSAAGGETVATLERVDGRWRVAEAHGYAADWPQLQQLLSGLAAAEVVEAKTANPEYYPRLGVEDTALPDAAGLRVGFAADSGLPAVILGQRAQGRGGQYARLADAEQSLLIDRELEAARETAGWLDAEIVDIPADEVTEVSVTHPDGDRVLARKASPGEADFELQDVAEGKEPRSGWTVNALAGGLASLELDGVAPASEIDWSDSISYRVRTADGLDLGAELKAVPGAEGEAESHWLRLEATLYTTALGATADAGTGPDETDAAVRGRADRINERTRGWAYRIPQYKFTAMAKHSEDLVQDAAAPE